MKNEVPSRNHPRMDGGLGCLPVDAHSCPGYFFLQKLPVTGMIVTSDDAE